MPEKTPHRRLQAFGLALVIEAAIIVGAAAVLIGMAPAKAAFSNPVPITLTEMPPEEKPPEPKTPPPKTPPPPPSPKMKAVAKLNLPKPPQEQPQAPQEALPLAPAPAAVATASSAFAEPAPTPLPPPSTSGKADARASYAAMVNAAVKAVHMRNYPAAAAMTRFSGQTRIEFHLRDGMLLGEPQVLISCGNAMFDQSALRAVQSAHYPEPPKELRGDDLNMTVWVEFVGR